MKFLCTAHDGGKRSARKKKKEYTENKYEMYANGLWLDLLTLGSSLDSPALFSASLRLPPVAFLSLTFGRRPDLAVFWYHFLWPNLMGNSKRVKQVHTHEDKRVIAMVICKVIMP